MPPRKCRRKHSYNVLSNEQTKCIFDLAELGLSIRNIATQLNLGPSTVQYWTQKYKQQKSYEKENHIPVNTKITKEVGEFIIQELDKDGNLSLDEIRKMLINTKGVSVNRTTIHQFLRREGFRRVVPKIRDPKAFTPENEAKRYEYAKIMSSFYGLKDGKTTKKKYEVCFYLDESSFQISKRNTKIWSREKDPVVEKPLSVHSVNTIMCIGVNGIVNFRMSRKPMVTADVESFIRECVSRIRPQLDNKYMHTIYFFMDNAPIHKRDTIAEKHRWKPIEDELRCSIMFTSPYSPEFNPIEEVFGTMKRNFYNSTTIRKPADIENYITEFVSRHENSPNVFLKYYEHMFEKMDEVLKRNKEHN